MRWPLGILLFFIGTHLATAQQGRLVFPRTEHFITTDTDFEITPQVENFLPEVFRMINKPSGADFDQATGNFKWNPRRSDVGTYFLTFIAADTSGQEISQAIYLRVETPRYAPQLSFIEKNFDDSVQPIVIRERLDTVRFKILATDRNWDDVVRFQFTINGLSTPPINGYSLDIFENTVFFKWIPDDAAAKQKSFRFEIEAFDSKGLSDEITLNFLVEDFNFPPEILNQNLSYEILPGESTHIDIRARDWDGDEMEYQLITSGIPGDYIKLNDRRGFLNINIPGREIQNVLGDGLEVTVRASEINDPTKFSDITFHLKQANTNVAPEVVISKTDFNIQEGQQFKHVYRVFDANGNQNIRSELTNPPEGLTVTQVSDNTFELSWEVDFNYLKNFSRGEERRTYESELVASDGLLDSRPVKLKFTIINQEDPELLTDEFFEWKMQADRFLKSMNIKAVELDKKANARKKSNKWLGFLGASIGAFGGLSATAKNGTALNSATPYIVFTSALVTGFVALRTPPAEYTAVSNELKRMQIQLKSTEDAMERLAAEKMDRAFRNELGKAVDLLKATTNNWVIQQYPKYAELMKLKGPDLEFSGDRESSITYTR